LKKTVQKHLLSLVSSSEILESIAVGLIGTEPFYGLVRDEAVRAVSGETVRAAITKAVQEAVAVALRDSVIVVNDNDILIVPSDGIGEHDFDRLARLIPKDRHIGVIAASDVKLLRLS